MLSDSLNSYYIGVRSAKDNTPTTHCPGQLVKMLQEDYQVQFQQTIIAQYFDDHNAAQEFATQIFVEKDLLDDPHCLNLTVKNVKKGKISRDRRIGFIKEKYKKYKLADRYDATLLPKTLDLSTIDQYISHNTYNKIAYNANPLFIKEYFTTTETITFQLNHPAGLKSLKQGELHYYAKPYLNPVSNDLLLQLCDLFDNYYISGQKIPVVEFMEFLIRQERDFTQLPLALELIKEFKLKPNAQYIINRCEAYVTSILEAENKNSQIQQNA
jgi:hypothetical protein